MNVRRKEPAMDSGSAAEREHLGWCTTVAPMLERSRSAADAWLSRRCRLVGLVAALALTTGCPAPNTVPCGDDANCNLAAGGSCVAGPSSARWCAYPDPSCDSGYRFSELDVGDGVGGLCVSETGPLDAGVDVPDAPPGYAPFDLAYVKRWELGTGASVLNESLWVQIVNKSAAPLDLSEAVFTSVTDDHSRIIVSMSVENNAGVLLSPGFSFGALSGGASSLVRAVVSEPFAVGGDSVGLIRVTVSDLPAAGTWLVVTGVGTLRIGDAFINVSVTVASSGTGTLATPVEAVRITSSAL